ncbi:MAG: hypothetical protein A3K77_03160 [Euryarchaeota archaeon RBG_13_31_8]|nr:MAG: hypothetical protein A3K77_03160 [Euryarchaeota archaeon RBG_13_31_8]
MKKQLIIIGINLVLFAVVFTGCTEQNPYKNFDKRLINTEFLGGKYNLSILYLKNYYDGTWADWTQINYTKNGNKYIGVYAPFMREALDWIKTNTSENCSVLCWWDYGHMVEGFAERNAIATSPSISLEWSMAGYQSMDEEHRQKMIEEVGGWSTNETHEDIAAVLTTNDFQSNETQDIIEKYNVSYILTRSYDKYLYDIFFKTAGKDTDLYVANQDGYELTLTEKGEQTLIFQLWKDNYMIPGLELVYNYVSTDISSNNISNVRIFKVSTS